MPSRIPRTRTTVTSPDGVELATWRSGPEGPAVVLLHGITMTGDYVLMGSDELQRRGMSVVGLDARGHGSSGPAPDGDYGYARMTDDLVAVLDAHGIERALLVGSSMGAHTSLRLALERPERVAGVVVITPGFDPRTGLTERQCWELDRLAEGIRSGGIDGFIAGLREIDDPVVDLTFLEVTRRRLAQHRDLRAVADAIASTVRDRPYESLDELRAVAAPAVVIGSRDRLDPRHPYELAVAHAEALGADLHVEEEGRLPLAWKKRAVVGHILALAERAYAQ